MQLNIRIQLFTATLALLASTGLAGRSLLAPAPAPANCQTVVDFARQNQLTTALIAAEAAGLTSTLNDSSTAYTVFVPTNQAFSDASKKLNVTAMQILNNQEQLRAILDNHLLAYPLTAADLLAKKTVETEDNSTLSIAQAGSTVQVSTPVQTAQVVQANITACKSIVHVVNALLVPQL